MPVAEPAAAATEEPSMLTSANLRVVNDPTSTDVDLVSLSLELFLRLFPGSQKDHRDRDKPRYVMIKFVGVPDYFDKFAIYKVTLIDEHDPTANMVTLTNSANLTRFGASFTVRGCAIQSIDALAIPTLSKVFVKVHAGVYDLLLSAPSSAVKDQFISRYLASRGGVVAQNDTIRAINGTVCLCEPVHQGFVAPLTTLVFVKGAPEDTAVQAPEQEDTLDLSQYLAKTISLGEPEESSYALLVRPLPHPISIPQPVSAKEDSELFAFLSTSALSQVGFPIFNGDLAVLNVSGLSLVVKVFTFLEPNKSFAADTIYLSPLLLANLAVDETTKAVLKPYTGPGETFFDAVPIAKTATISRIASPITMDKTYQQSFLAGLKSTFHLQSKCVRKNDFVAVCVDSVLAKALFDVSQQSGNEEDSNDAGVTPTGDPDAVAWFKVVEITGEESSSEDQQYRIDPSKTALTSSGVEYVRAPKNKFNNWADYLGLPPIFNYLQAIAQSPANFKYAQEFHRILNTGINSASKIDLKTTVLLNSMSRGLGKTNLVRSTALELGLNLIELDAFDFIKPGAELKTIGLLTGRIEKQLSGQLEAASYSNYHIILIKHIENLCVKVDPNEQGANSSNSLSLKVIETLQEFLRKYKNLALVATCNDVDKLSDSFRQIITFQIDVGVPSELERLAILNFLLEKETQTFNNETLPESFEERTEFTGRPNIFGFQLEEREDISHQSLALQSAGLTPRDLMSIIKMTKQLAIKRLSALAKSSGTTIEKLIKVGNGGHIIITPEDFEKAINDARSQFSDSIGAPRIPNVKWEDIGGLDLVKDEILDTIDMPLKHPELFSNGLKKRSGILFYGPPGTGKTLLAKAIATNFSLNFFSVKGPELLNMYIGESEANVRRVFQRARDAKPCVIFFDELDSVAPKRGNQGDSGGVMDRIVSQLLAELDGMSGGENNGDGVFVVGATNRPDLLDEALLRPGRFDKMLYLGISDTDEKQTKILEALTRKFKLSNDVDLAKVAERCSFTFTGADFYALCSDSMLNAMTRIANEVDAKLKKYNEKRVAEEKEEVLSRWWFDNEATAEDINVVVTMQDFRKAQAELVPSVSAEELAHYLRVKENFEGVKKKPESEQSIGHDNVNGNFEQTFAFSHDDINGHNLEQSITIGHDDTNGHDMNGHLGDGNGHINGH